MKLSESMGYLKFHMDYAFFVAKERHLLNTIGKMSTHTL